MRVTLKLYASLAKFLPAEARENQAEIELPDGASIRDLLVGQNVPLPQCHLVLLNGVFQPPARAAEVRLAAGDAVACWPPVAGG